MAHGNFRRLAWLATAFFMSVAPVRAEPIDGGHAVIDLIADHETVAPGDTIRGALTLQLDPHWHVYWKNPGDSGLPAEILWDEPVAASVGAFYWPAPNPQPIETLMNYGYEDRLVLPFDITIPEDADGSVLLTGLAQYLICEDICIPEEAPVSLYLPVGEASVRNTTTAEPFAWADARLPIPFDGDAVIDRTGSDWKLSLKSDVLRDAFGAELTSVRFYPEDHQIQHAADQPVSIGPDGVTLTLQEADGLGDTGNLAGVLVLEDTAGNRIAFEVNAMPGEVLVEKRGRPFKGVSSKASSSSASTLGVFALIGILGAALLGGVILNLMPCVLPVLFIKARSFLSLAGHDDHKAIQRHGLFYSAGVIVCFVGFGLALALLRAAGEQAGLGFQLQYPPVVAALALLMFVLGLNMLGVFEFGSSLMGVGSGLVEKGGDRGAFFTGVLAAFVGAPCIGPFIGAATGVVVTQPLPIILLVFFFLGLGMALPFALLSFFPKLLSALPKPGAWMERLKQFFAFPLFLTALWLIWVLGQQAGNDAVILTVFGGLLIAFAIWLVQVAPGPGMLRAACLSLAALSAIAGVVLPVIELATSAGDAPVAREGFVTTDYEDAWSPEKVEALRAEGRPVFIDFTASWCVTCQVNKRTTLLTKQVQSAFEQENVAFLIADWTRRDKLIGAELARQGRAGVPLYLYYPAGATEPVVLPQILSVDLMLGTIEKGKSS